MPLTADKGYDSRPLTPHRVASLVLALFIRLQHVPIRPPRLWWGRDSCTAAGGGGGSTATEGGAHAFARLPHTRRQHASSADCVHELLWRSDSQHHDLGQWPTCLDATSIALQDTTRLFKHLLRLRLGDARNVRACRHCSHVDARVKGDAHESRRSGGLCLHLQAARCVAICQLAQKRWCAQAQIACWNITNVKPHIARATG